MTLGPRPVLVLTLPALASALLMLAQPASAQTEPAKADAGLERAQKAADAVFHWIKLNGDKGATRQPTAPAAAPTPAPAPAPVARKAAPAPTPVAAAPRPAPTPAPAPTQTAAAAVDTVTTPASAVAQAPAPVAQQEPPPVLLASAAPIPAPDAPLAQAAKATEQPPEEDDEEPLRLLSKVNPTMPRQLPPTFRRGIAQVQFTIAPNGQVAEASVLKATHSRLGSAAVEAVKQWRFAPIQKARNVAIEIAFSNEDS